MVLLTHGPRVDPCQAVFFEPLQLLHILLRRPALSCSTMFGNSANVVRNHGWVAMRLQIAFGILHLSCRWIGATTLFAAPPFPLLAQQNDWWRHELRNMVR